MGRNSTTRTNARKIKRGACPRTFRDSKKCDCPICKLKRNQLEDGARFLDETGTLILYIGGECMNAFDLMYKTFKAKEFYNMADGDKIVQIDTSDPYDASVDNLMIRKNLVCYADGCENTTNLKRCSCCRMIRYCSEECQKRDWKEHKNSCVPKEKPKIEIFNEKRGYSHVVSNNTEKKLCRCGRIYCDDE
ncbi:histone-lysine N-methyltransferase / SET domain containing protein [Paramecium bursaria Chlorella virus NYs1]|uniref:Histone-lysine N-methyltransferase / SET domain containing protein n=1 Tax=Paramecium bursaria Chlorella virus NYs1 TaxID=83442 RepID=M1I8R9_9PHYC|nr:histone-lysine N-methyltransferase / SET domain containing protein [Paramecium bursaria Chlorella virus NYs1]AGE54815.1 histone-lysine N-methyltransferase / SET domain containing protein [Paramecium bursaria Chlorella virus MA1D]AGE58666.1 histone-lysine N-methyltransferase / SET domain containing protein [Paramecium bursaria Chlorella virus NYs1]